MINAPEAANIERMWVGNEGFNFLSDEGLRAAAMRYYPASVGPMCTSFCQPISLQPLSHTANALIAMQSELRAMKHLALIFSSWPTAFSDQKLIRNTVDDLVVLERCEAEPGALLSFGVGLSGNQILGRFSSASVMVDCHVFDGRVRYKFSRFISTKLLDRFIWMLRSAGESLDAIATEVNLNKSSVKRRLDKLPPVVRRVLQDGWQLAYREALELLDEEDD